MKKAHYMAAVMTAALAALLSSCGPSQSVTDLKAAVIKLRLAGEQDGTSQDTYNALLLDAKTRLELANGKLSDNAVSVCNAGLARGADVILVWEDIAGVQNGLTPDAEAPLKRLGVVGNDAEFRKVANVFAPFEPAPDDDSPNDNAEKNQALGIEAAALVKQALSGAGQAQIKCEAAL